MPRINQIQVRRDTAANWTSVDPVLAAGEMGLETDTRKTKFGDGTTSWTSLAYATSAGLISSDTAPDSPSVGAQWFNSSTGKTYVYYDGYWIELDSNGTSAQSNGNAIINGAFDIWQRGTSFTGTGFTADRWNSDNSGGTVTSTQQTHVPGSAPESGYEGTFFHRSAISGQSLASDLASLQQLVEDVRSFAGQTITYSFWAKANSGTPKISLELEQGFGTGGSPSAAVRVNAGQVTISTSWARYSLTIAVPSISGKTLGTTANTSSLRTRLWLSAGSNFNDRTGSLGIQNNTFDIWGVQLEAGPVATPFKRNANSLQGELAACQRYYYRNNGAAYWANGGTRSTTQADFLMQYPVTMRTAPTALEQNGTAGSYSVRHGNTNTTCSAVPTFNGASVDAAVFTFTVASGLTLGQAAFARNLSGYLAWSAEL